MIKAQTGSTITVMLDTSSESQQSHLPQPATTINITSEGLVVGTDQITREENVYTFTGDILGIIRVYKDGITIDGAGYAIKGHKVDGLRGDEPANPGVSVYFLFHTTQ